MLQLLTTVEHRQLTDEQKQRRRQAATVIWAALVLCIGWQGWRLDSQRRATEAEVARSKFWRSVVDNIDVGTIVVRAADGKIDAWSAGATRLLGWKDTDVIGKPVDYLMPTADRDAHQDIRSDPTIQQTLADCPLILDCWAMSSSHEYVPVHARIVTIRIEPARYLVTLDKSDNIQRLPPRPKPTEDPRTVQTFDAKKY